MPIGRALPLGSALVLLGAVALSGCTKLAGIDGDYTVGKDASAGGGTTASGGTAGSAATGGTGGSAATGGQAGSGGAAGAGGSTGGAAGAGGSTGGAAGAGGSTGGAAGSGGAGGTTSCPALAAAGVFPSPSATVLDDFNRPDGQLAGAWSGDLSIGEISSNQLGITNANKGWGQLLLPTYLCPDQEAFLTVKAIDPNSDFFILQLKMQNLNDCDQIEVYWARVDNTTGVSVCESGNWTDVGKSYPLTLNPGDVFGARARANGQVEIYANGSLVKTYDVSNWVYSQKGGFPGLEFDTGSGKWRMDDFGGTG